MAPEEQHLRVLAPGHSCWCGGRMRKAFHFRLSLEAAPVSACGVMPQQALQHLSRGKAGRRGRGTVGQRGAGWNGWYLANIQNKLDFVLLTKIGFVSFYFRNTKYKYPYLLLYPAQSFPGPMLKNRAIPSDDDPKASISLGLGLLTHSYFFNTQWMVIHLDRWTFKFF